MSEREVHLRDYLAVLQKYDFVICLSVLLLLGSALVVSVRLPKIYQASTLLLFDQPASNPPVSSANVFQNVLSGGVDRSEMETIGQRFLSESILISAIERLEDAQIDGIHHLPSTGKLRRNLNARSRPDSQYIELSLQLSEAEGGERNAALLTNQLVSEMQTLRSQKEADTVAHRLELLNEKWEELLENVRFNEGQARKFVREKGGPGTWQQELTHAFTRRAVLRGQREGIEMAIESSSLELEHLRSEIGKLQQYIKQTETVGYDPIWLSQMETLIGLEGEKAGLIAQGMAEKAPRVQSLDAQIEKLQERLSALGVDTSVTSVAQGVNPLYSVIEERLMNLKTGNLRGKHSLLQIEPKLEKVERQLGRLLKDIPEDQLELDRLKREIGFLHELTKETYTRILQTEMLLAESNRWNTKSTNGHTIGGIEVVDIAVPRKIPTSPRIKFIVAIGGIVGLAVGISIALFMTYFSNVYSSAEEVGFDLHSFSLGHVSNLGRVGPLVSGLEDYQAIAANINLSNSEQNRQVLMLTGCNRNEAISVVTANLGATLASVSENVLILDCNLRLPKQHEIFGIAQRAHEEVEVTDVQNWQQVIQKTHIANLDLLSINAFASTPIEILHSSRLQSLFEKLRGHYELILLDSAPTLGAPDGLALGVHADAVALVINLITTTRQSLRSTRDRIVHAGVPLIGFIDV